MSLSKRDTLVRWLDPLETIWEDAEGNIHYSIENILRAFELPDTPEHRRRIISVIREQIAARGPDHQPKEIIERDKPDSPEYFRQKTKP